ncbi:UPF0175 family protein [Desulfofundulus thermocisternus]|uniref:UPF0175 family protein n=1 Tax=Desulfofundulus thermocisternus TaxID=42471 RepID=UPI0019E806DE|nr:UPF0175 family protein [Desulfofundulus thermocisternus]MBE3586000.1 UPF0175 family protein [Thermoanaerobacter sp.]MCS5695078.1 UPF0175 family protein [Desulfofundulus thermocisternus]
MAENAGKAAFLRGIILPGVVKVREVVLRIPEEIQDVLGVRRNLAREIMKRLAVSLYAERKISLGKAVELSGTDYFSFLETLADFGVSLDYDEQDLADDLETLGRLRYGSGE